MDPLWAILSDPSKENGRWQLDDFFKTGTQQLQALQSELSQIDHSYENDRCLDFGCGIGRMSRAFRSMFREVHGVDIASSMIREAKKHHQSYSNIMFHLNQKNDLTLFPDNHFDFILSIIVLQHIPPEMTKNYLREFIRVLKPGGVMAFQLPSHVRQSTDKLSFNAKIRCDAEAKQYSGDAKLAINATVNNIGEATWSTYQTSQEQFRLGNHWLDSNGQTVILDDGRCDIPELTPGDSCNLVLEINTPSQPGNYWLVLDVVQEHVTWFENAGSEVYKIPVEIFDKTKTNTTSPLRPNHLLRSGLVNRLKNKLNTIFNVRKPKYEMHGIKKKEVVDILTQAGATVIKIRDDTSAGPNWESYYYFASK